MSTPIDLCTPEDVKSYLGIIPSQPGAGSPVQALVTANIAYGLQTVTLNNAVDIQVGMTLAIDIPPNREYVYVTAVNPPQFTAMFSMTHTVDLGSPGIQVTDETTQAIQNMISSAGLYFLRRTGNIVSNIGNPTSSPLNSVVSCDERYDGNNHQRLALYHFPIISVSLVTVNGVSIPQATNPDTSPGWVIDQSGRFISIVNSTAINYPYGMGFSAYYRNLGCIGGYTFYEGIQNVHVQYTAGYSAVPYDLFDANVQLVGLNYSRRKWIDVEQNSQGETIGTTKYRDWLSNPYIEDVVSRYTRRAVI